MTTPPDESGTAVVEEPRTQSAARPGELLGAVCVDARADELTARGVPSTPVSYWPPKRADSTSTAASSCARKGPSRHASAAKGTCTRPWSGPPARLCTVTAQPA
ncbi:hypothetical protein [Streptomyces cremeus]|uniref:hypothetical protein n=1 Tax=Streptomyces cremeus TaxID=66881 RepID=UPI0031E7E6C1